MTVNKPLTELWFTNINFMVCYSVLTITTLFLFRKTNKFILILFTVLNVISLSLLLDAIDEIYYSIDIITILSHIIVLSPFYMYIYFLYRFKILSCKTIYYLSIGIFVEIVILILKLNFPDILRYIWLLIFILILL